MSYPLSFWMTVFPGLFGMVVITWWSTCLHSNILNEQLNMDNILNEQLNMVCEGEWPTWSHGSNCNPNGDSKVSTTAQWNASQFSKSIYFIYNLDSTVDLESEDTCSNSSLVFCEASEFACISLKFSKPLFLIKDNTSSPWFVQGLN